MAPSRSLKKRCKSKQIPDNQRLSGIFVLSIFLISAELFGLMIITGTVPYDKGNKFQTFFYLLSLIVRSNNILGSCSSLIGPNGGDMPNGTGAGEFKFTTFRIPDELIPADADLTICTCALHRFL